MFKFRNIFGKRNTIKSFGILLLFFFVIGKYSAKKIVGFPIKSIHRVGMSHRLIHSNRSEVDILTFNTQAGAAANYQKKSTTNFSHSGNKITRKHEPLDQVLLTDLLINAGKKNGVSAGLDWKWLDGLQQLDIYNPYLYFEGKDSKWFFNKLSQQEREQLKIFETKVHLGKKCNIVVKGEGRIQINKDSTLVYNELISISSIRIIGGDTACSCAEANDHCAYCELYGNRHTCCRVIFHNEATLPLTSETLTIDFLNGIRSDEMQIDLKNTCQ